MQDTKIPAFVLGIEAAQRQEHFEAAGKLDSQRSGRITELAANVKALSCKHLLLLKNVSLFISLN